MQMNHSISVPIRYALGVLLILALSLALFYWLARPPIGDLSLMAVFLSITAVISGIAGFAAYRQGWMERSPSLRLTLLGINVIASVLVFFNVWVTAKLMFTSRHDLFLATVLLIFAGSLAMVLGSFLSSTITDRIQKLDQTAREIQQGNLHARTPERGNDELAELSKTFNQMAARLEQATKKQHELDTLRRDLVAWAGHDLQTPLASVRAILEALADGVVDEPEMTQHYLSTAQRDIQNLSKIIDDLFQMAQLDAGGVPLKKEKASLGDLISDSLESFSELAARQEIRLEGRVDAEVGLVMMDVQHIGRVLTNLISNALRYTPNGGEVIVLSKRQDTEVIVEVSDNGEGIQPEDIPHIFERFYRGEKSRSRSTGGSGLGLAIAQGIIQAHGGRIEVESSPGKGSCFRFYISSPPFH